MKDICNMLIDGLFQKHEKLALIIIAFVIILLILRAICRKIKKSLS